MAHEFANQCLLTPSVSFDHSINSSAFALMVLRAYREKTGEGVYKKFGKQRREYFKLVSCTVPILTISGSPLSRMPSDNPQKTAQELNTPEEPLNTSEHFLRFSWASGVPATHICLSSNYHMHLSMLHVYLTPLLPSDSFPTTLYLRLLFFCISL